MPCGLEIAEAEVCKTVQDKVKTGVENMTGLDVREVDIHIATVAGTNK